MDSLLLQFTVICSTLLTVSEGRALIQTMFGECPRGYKMEGDSQDCDPRSSLKCLSDDDCPVLSRCCFSGCGLSCRSLKTLVRTYCVEEGVTYHPGEMFQSGCEMCECMPDGYTFTCEIMPNCGQPNVIMLPDGPIDSEDIVASTVAPGPRFWR